MATDEVYEFTITTPAGTLASTPLVSPTVFPSRLVRRIEWRVPAGSMGVMGWQISMRGVPVIPRNTAGFIVAHSTSGGWDLQNQPETGDWSVTSYNTGASPHALYVTYHCDVFRPADIPLELLTADQLTGEPSPDFTGA